MLPLFIKKLLSSFVAGIVFTSPLYSQNYFNWGSLLDTSNNTLLAGGTSTAGSQIFDIGTPGVPCLLTVSWSGDFDNGPGSSGQDLENGTDGGNSNTITFTLQNGATADWDFLSEGGNNTGRRHEFGTLTSDGIIDYTIISGGLSTLSGDNTGLVTYGTSSSNNDRGSFSATIAGANTFSYTYNLSSLSSNRSAQDPFQIGFDPATVKTIPEPSLFFSFSLTSFLLLTRRKRH